MSTAMVAQPTSFRIPSPVYWIATILIALNFAFGGVTALLGVPASTEVFTRLGYPVYFGNYLAIWQLLAAAALLIPARPRFLREWAYAGLVFDVISALYSLVSIKSPVLQMAPALFIFALLIVSYCGWRQRQSVVEI